MCNSSSLFGKNWMEEFGLYDDPINTFCNKIDGFITSSDKLKKEPKEKKKNHRNIF